MQTQPYSPPPGYVDFPFIWIYELDNSMNGQDALNLSLYLKIGFGAFVLRRIAGVSGVLSPTDGKFHMHDSDLDNYIQSRPIAAQNSDEIAVVPEIVFNEGGSITFDLYDVLVV